MRVSAVCLTAYAFAMQHSGGGGVTTIHTGTGLAFSGVPFFEQKINFGVSFLVKS